MPNSSRGRSPRGAPEERDRRAVYQIVYSPLTTGSLLVGRLIAPGLPTSLCENLPVTSRLFRAFPALLVFAASAIVVLAVSRPAGAATPCGKKVLGDWFDNGRIDRLYPLNCYEEAIDAIPPDLRDYADAEDVITRALQAALHGNLAPGGSDPTPGDNSGGNGAGGGSDGTDGSTAQGA